MLTEKSGGDRGVQRERGNAVAQETHEIFGVERRRHVGNGARAPPLQIS